MGTRHLIAVKSNGVYKVAQYGQWDGYPSGQGVSVLNFLKSIDLRSFKIKLDSVEFYTEEELQSICDKHTDNGSIIFGSAHHKYWEENLAHISRNAGAKILDMIYSGGVRKVKNSLPFAGDSLFCEYGYVVDLDDGVFEVYEGFNHTPITEGRFISSDSMLEKKAGYEPIKIVKSYSLINLPDEEQFLKDLEPEDEEE